MKVVVRKSPFGDWEAQCGCGERITTDDWRGAMEIVLGHLCFAHHLPIQHEVPC